MSAEYPTPLYAHAARGHFRDVYEPSEDSFLLMDALEKDVDELRQMRPRVCVEVGSGSGAVSAFLASMLGPSAIYFCTDVNRAAALCTAKTASRNGVSLEPVVTDLVECLLPRLSGQVDVLLFNPPYVVTPSSEVALHLKSKVCSREMLESVSLFICFPPVAKVGSTGMEAAWAGGRRGREVTDRFLPVVSELLSSRGLFYLVAIAENDPEEMIQSLSGYGLEGKPRLLTRAGNERLSVLRFHWRQRT